jgi:hypothetical protein
LAYESQTSMFKLTVFNAVAGIMMFGGFVISYYLAKRPRDHLWTVAWVVAVFCGALITYGPERLMGH